MNTKSLLALLPAVSLLAGCSNDTQSNAPSDLQSIQFSVNVPNAPRVPTTTETIKTFNTWAFADGKPYMSNVEVVKGENGLWGYSPTAYWPVDESLNFYSYSPALETTKPVTADSPDIADYKSPGDVDLLYGVNMDVNGKTDKQVHINFRHALSQIRFFIRKQPASISNRAIDVKISELKVVNVATTGSFNFPKETTSSTSTAKGEWVTTTDNGEIAVYANATADLGDEYAEYRNTGNIFAIPQTLTETEATAATYSGSYIRVLCKITDPATGVTLWPSASDPNYVNDLNGGYIVFPLVNDSNNNWELGNAYRYNLTIGIPSSTDRINFDVTVDEYQDFNDIPVEN
ncbi:MAG: fimbrillin family protein [Muribaculum sp.]|nr:fimbrillin family protein [Muribaculum sp.]